MMLQCRSDIFHERAREEVACHLLIFQRVRDLNQLLHAARLISQRCNRCDIQLCRHHATPLRANGSHLRPLHGHEAHDPRLPKCTWQDPFHHPRQTVAQPASKEQCRRGEAQSKRQRLKILQWTRLTTTASSVPPTPAPPSFQLKLQLQLSFCLSLRSQQSHRRTSTVARDVLECPLGTSSGRTRRKEGGGQGHWSCGANRAAA
mmetsp:Transcript_3409/g.10713  ORF Transcript_3409/g.10713 Transcript_3409/m.10713 type:complete len:204 (-) Transcript_3409:313-924(-)